MLKGFQSYLDFWYCRLFQILQVLYFYHYIFVFQYFFYMFVQNASTGWTIRGSNPGGGEIFRSRPDRPWDPPSLLYNGYRVSFPGVKRPGRGVDHPPPSNAEVKERVELYLYSPSGLSWPVLGLTLSLPCSKRFFQVVYRHQLANRSCFIAN
jgi:hypothetical protein